MSSNLHQPARLQDCDAPDARPPRPKAVRHACGLVVAAFVLGLVTFFPGVHVRQPDDPNVSGIYLLAIVVTFGAVLLSFTYATLQRRNWARWALLMYLINGWLLTARHISHDFDRTPLLGSLAVATTGMELLAVWLLFTGIGAKWFSARKPQSSAEA